MTAGEIADRIWQAAEKAVNRELSVEECSEQTRVLWEAARSAGVADEVGRLLQAASDAEMTRAMARMSLG